MKMSEKKSGSIVRMEDVLEEIGRLHNCEISLESFSDSLPYSFKFLFLYSQEVTEDSRDFSRF